MRQVVEVTKLLGRSLAEVAFERRSACSGDCAHCGGCDAIRQYMVVVAKNPIGARPGDRVVLETNSGFVLSAAVLVYLIPLITFFAGYFVGDQTGAPAGLCGAAGFVVGLIPMLLRNRQLKKYGGTTFEIIEFAQE